MVIDDVVAGMRSLIGRQYVGHVRAFHRGESQIEGWFKGEMIVLLDEMKRAGKVAGFEHAREHTVEGGRKKYDFVIAAEGETHAVEIKSWLIGKQKGDTYNAYWYFTDTGTPLEADAAKLKLWKKGRKVIIAYCYRRPEVDDWRLGVKAFQRAFPSHGLVALNEPPDGYPEDFFIGVLEVGARKFRDGDVKKPPAA